jgi:Domain of unknown function (DUF4926)
MASRVEKSNDSTHSFDEFDVVRLRYDTIDDGILYRAGSMGAVVYLHEDADAYEVEFSEPEWGVLTLGISDIVPVDEAAA